MGLSLGGLGSLAGGLAQGIERGQIMQERRQRSLADLEDQQWQRGQRERQAKQQAALDDANAAPDRVYEESKAQWALNGAQGEYQPSETTNFNAAQARSQALSKHKLWDEFVKNEVAVQPMRTRVRTEALQRFELDGDAGALAETVYPTVFDGKQIVGKTKLNNAANRQEAEMWRFTLSDGTTKTVKTPELVANIKKSLISPEQTAKLEIMANLERAKAQFHGDETRKTNASRHTEKMDEIAALNAGAKERTQIGADASKVNTETRADASMYGADQRPTAAGAANMRQGLVQERLAAEKHIDQILDQISQLRGVEGKRARSGLEKELADAKTHAARIREKLVNPGGTDTNGSPQPGSSRGNALPASKTQLRVGQIYQTARGPARWNGTAFEAQ